MAGTILVTGATGTIGGEVTRQLIAKGVRPRLLVRDPAKAREFEGKAELVKGDLGDAASLERAMQGVEKLFLVGAGVDGQVLEAKAVDAAKKAGVKHVVKLSVLGAQEETLAFGRWHRPVEKKLEASGLAWTFLRPVNFMSNMFNNVDSIKGQGAFYQPTGDGKTSVIDPADIGAVAVKALTEPGHEGKAYTLTGPQALSGAEQAAVLTKALGREVKFVDVPPEAAKQAMAGSGIPPVYVDALMDLLANMKAGQTAVVTDTVRKVLGREPGTFEDWARRHAAAFR
ncbi:SDR family oxidoreductase [Pyxidicoccus parkwayensis]|uniref:SDR family oxidoreductase n=1 Tax=Pyxidicoccus parkwayensis TaxID=2813578 RepID=A0ABX7NQV2_9BACT|nr:SDR family oxidoreductase [Pyxidicoccus parkwaysis]QSQ21078.1 SDR family oxidoreductase [Pyxidicoccus parkwaysis]